MLFPKKFSVVASFALAILSGCDSPDKSPATSEVAVTNPSGGQSKEPLYRGNGFNDQCIGCITWWAQKEDPNKTNDPIYDWNALQRKCREKGQCQFFDYVNAWSPFVAIERIVNGPAARWATYRKEGKKAACFYEHPYFTGSEACYEAPVTTTLPNGLAGQVSSFRLVNINTVTVTFKNGKKVTLEGDGFNLIEDHNDSIVEVSF